MTSFFCGEGEPLREGEPEALREGAKPRRKQKVPHRKGEQRTG